MPNIRKKQTLLKTVIYVFKIPIMYIYQEILDNKKALFYIIKERSSLNVKISVIGLGNVTIFFFSVFSDTPGLLNKSIIY